MGVSFRGLVLAAFCTLTLLNLENLLFLILRNLSFFARVTEWLQKTPSPSLRYVLKCQTCPVQHLCVPKAQPHRMIRVGASHDVLQQRRREEQTEDFKLRMHQRNGIEGTISELVRGHGMRRARYRAFEKVDLQNQLIATACNIKQWLEKLARVAPQPYPEVHLGACNLIKSLALLISNTFSYLSDPLTPFGAPNPVFLGL